MAKRVKLPKKVVRGERMRPGMRYKIIGTGKAKARGFFGTLVARFDGEDQSWAIFRNIK